MIAAFKPGLRVYWTLCDEEAEITNYMKKYDWKIPGYLGEGFYLIRILSTGQERIAHEDDLTIIKEVTA